MFKEMAKFVPNFERFSEKKLLEYRTDGHMLYDRVEGVFGRIKDGLRTSFDFSDTSKFEGIVWIGGVSLTGLLVMIIPGNITQVDRPINMCSLCSGDEGVLSKWQKVKTDFNNCIDDDDKSYTLFDVAKNLSMLIELAKMTKAKQEEHQCKWSKDPLVLLLQTELAAKAIFIPGSEDEWVLQLKELAGEQEDNRYLKIEQRFKNIGFKFGH